MVVLAGSELFNFILDNREKFKDSKAISTLMALKDSARNCCKCERRQKMQKLIDYFGSLAHQLTEEDKSIIKELNDEQSVQITMDNQLIVEIL